MSQTTPAAASSATPDLAIEVKDLVATVEICRPPHNYFDVSLIQQLATTFEGFDDDPAVRAIVLCARGKSFCAGANFTARSDDDPKIDIGAPGGLYFEAIRLFRTRKPIIAAVQGPAIGGGLGLAVMADFRIASRDSRFAANFSRLGIHCGFGLSVTLPRLVGEQKAAMLLYTGRRIAGDEAVSIGLADQLVEPGQERAAAQALAAEIAGCAPLAVVSMRETLRAGLADAVRTATEREASEQSWQSKTADFAEGVAATAARRPAAFQGK